MKCKRCGRHLKKEEYYDDTYAYIGYCFMCLNYLLENHPRNKLALVDTFKNNTNDYKYGEEINW